jgi:multiple sugar transport system substrate-binding protein
MAAVLAVSMSLVACSGSDDSGGGGGEGGGELTVWTVEDNAQRVAQQKTLVQRYTQTTGTKVKLVALGEDQLTPVLTSAAAANDLPDAIGALSIASVNQLYADDLLDVDAAMSVLSDLGEGTFSKRALELTRDGDTQLSIPSDGFANLLYYRKDLFDKAGLAVPDNYDAITKAAQTLNSAGTAGIVAATAPADSFTQQTFEQLAVANGCQLAEGDSLTLDSDKCVRTFDFYGNLMKNHSVAGAQDADTTRATYFAGKAAMVIWSTFLLDELAGLRNDALPTCPQCKADKKFLAKNTGVVGAIKGPDGPSPATWGEIVSWATLRDSDAKTRDFVKFMMSDGYEDWLKIAPEGRVPVRNGTADAPTKYADAWKTFPIGVDKKAKMSDLYGTAILDAVAKSPESFSRWGGDGNGKLAAVVAGQFVVPKAVAKMINSGASASDVAKEANAQAASIKKDLN